MLIWGQAVGYKGHGHSWLSQRVHGGCLSIAGAKTICLLFPLVGVVTLPLATLVMAAGVEENNATEFPGPLSPPVLLELLSQVRGEGAERSFKRRPNLVYDVYLIIKTLKPKAYLSFNLLNLTLALQITV